MPLIGIIIGGHDFSNLTLTIKDANVYYGAFIQNVIDFLIIAFCVFMFVKFINKLTIKKEEKKKEEKPKKDPQIELLEEIRDLLKENKKTTKKTK